MFSSSTTWLSVGLSSSTTVSFLASVFSFSVSLFTLLVCGVEASIVAFFSLVCEVGATWAFSSFVSTSSLFSSSLNMVIDLNNFLTPVISLEIEVLFLKKIYAFYLNKTKKVLYNL